jgi:hypothetical protein
MKQLKVYARGALVLIVVVAVGLVLFKNRSNAVSIWFFGLTDEAMPVNVIWLILFTAASTLVAWWTFRLGWGLWRDIRKMKRLRALDGAAKRLDERAAELGQCERGADGKLRRADSNGD